VVIESLEILTSRLLEGVRNGTMKPDDALVEIGFRFKEAVSSGIKMNQHLIQATRGAIEHEKMCQAFYAEHPDLLPMGDV